MNKLVIPTVLVAILVVIGIFAFMPVEPVTTLHNTILPGLQIQVLEFEKTLPSPDDGDDQLVTWTFTTDADNGAIITAIWVDNTPTINKNITVTCFDPEIEGDNVIDCPLDFDFSPDCTNEIFDFDEDAIDFNVDGCPNDADYRLYEWKVNDALLFSSEGCLDIRLIDRFAIINLHRLYTQKCTNNDDKPIFTNPDSIYFPITKGGSMELTFNNDNEDNDIQLNVIIAFKGGSNAELK